MLKINNNTGGKLCPNELADVVRKELFQSLRDLLQHGLIETNFKNSLVPVFTCFPIRAKEVLNELHAWDLLTKYYEIKVNHDWCIYETKNQKEKNVRFFCRLLS